MEIVSFHDKKNSFSNIFFIFPPMRAREDIFYFFSSEEGKKTLVGARPPNNILRVT